MYTIMVNGFVKLLIHEWVRLNYLSTKAKKGQIENFEKSRNYDLKSRSSDLKSRN